MASLRSRACQALLTCCRHLSLDAPVRLRALSLFADSYLPTLGIRPLPVGADGGPAEWQLQLAAVACVLMAVRSFEPAGQQALGHRDQALVRVYRAAGEVLGDQFGSQFTSRNLLEVEKEVQLATGPVQHKENTVGFLQTYFLQIRQTGLKAFNFEIDVCYTVLELLYSDGGGQFTGAIDRGGRLIAAAVIAAAFIIAAPLADVQASLPFLSWLADLCQYPKDVLQSQAQAIVQHVLA